MCRLIREYLISFNAEYLADRRDRRETVWNVAAIVIIIAGLTIAAWAWGG